MSKSYKGVLFFADNVLLVLVVTTNQTPATHLSTEVNPVVKKYNFWATKNAGISTRMY